MAPPDPEVARAAAQASSYSASLRVSLKGADLRGRAQALVAFQRPDRLRVEIPGPTGARLLAVARDGHLTAAFPSERAVYEGEATPEAFDALLGIALAPAEVIDLLVGQPSPRLTDYRAAWGPRAPREIQATLPDGARLTVKVEDPALEPSLPEAVFEPPAHAGYRSIDADEARRLWGRR
jgi:hypothetical protein